MSKFEIDFFEFSFLVEACIPPVPIARSSFWDKVCNYYYHQLSADERNRLFEWITDNPKYKDGVKKKNEQCRIFWHRYNPACQYHVMSKIGRRPVEEHDCFYMDGNYYIEYNSYMHSSVIEKYVISAKPINQ